jgi:hypothetical protein
MSESIKRSSILLEVENTAINMFNIEILSSKLSKKFLFFVKNVFVY